MLFRFEAVDSKGIEAAGELEATDEIQALRELKTRNLTVIKITSKSTKKRAFSKRKASITDLVTSMHEMITLLEAGVSVSDMLDSQRKADYPKDLLDGYQKMAREIRSGGSFSSALKSSGLDCLVTFFSSQRRGTQR